MKKVLLLGMLLGMLFANRAFAAAVTVTATGTTITASLSVANTDQYKLVLQTTPFTNNTVTVGVATNTTGIPGADPTVQQSTTASAQSPATLQWSIGGNLANTTYYARIADFPPTPQLPIYVTPSVTVQTQNANIPLLPITTSSSGSNIIVTGKLDTTQIPNFNPSDYSTDLIYTPTVPASTVTTLTGTDAGPAQVQSDGSYTWTLTSLNPSTVYYYQQTVKVDNQNSKTDTINHFNTNNGLTIQGINPSTAETAQESYTFLSDPTGATIFPDPDLCAQEQQQAQANGKTPPKCGLNDYLNLALSFLIGLSGVVLVLKLMWVGFEYMTTDLPFKKAGAKGQFITSLLGLLLVMTSYIILNTINPKLVNEQVNVQQLSIVNDTDTDPTPILQNPVGTPTSGSAGKCINGLTSVKVQQTTFVVCSSYTPPAGSAALLVNVNSSGAIPVAQNLQAMLTAAANAGLVLGGGGYRSAAQQTKLRTQNCNGDLTNPQAVCSPPTAPVGQSNHESGLAFDFKCNGSNQAIQNHSDPCYVWLNANAATYGFKNYPVEPWHWSIDGH